MIIMFGVNLMNTHKAIILRNVAKEPSINWAPLTWKGQTAPSNRCGVLQKFTNNCLHPPKHFYFEHQGPSPS